jgi:hypothetical protein
VKLGNIKMAGPRILRSVDWLEIHGLFVCMWALLRRGPPTLSGVSQIAYLT